MTELPVVRMLSTTSAGAEHVSWFPFSGTRLPDETE